MRAATHIHTSLTTTITSTATNHHQPAAAAAMVLSLPVTGDEQVSQFQSEWQAAYAGSSSEALEGAKCRLIWALVHASGSPTHLRRGLDLAQAALEADVRSEDEDRELRYYAAGERYEI